MTSRLNLVEMLAELQNGLLKVRKLVIENLDAFSKYLTMDIEEKKEYPKKDRLSEAKTNDLTIRSLGDALESKAVRILSLQAPVGHDLRFVISSFRMIYDFERVSRDAYNAFGKILDIDQSDIPNLSGQYTVFNEIIQNSLKLLEYFENVYSEKNDNDVKSIIENSILLDNTIDELFKENSTEILSKVNNNELMVETGYFLLSAIRSLERVGDHICNLIERGLYIKTGNKFEIK